MDENTLDLYARIQTMQTLISMLFAQSALATNRPIDTVAIMRGQAHRIMQNTWTRSATEEELSAFKERAAAIVAQIFDEIEGRVMDAPGR